MGRRPVPIVWVHRPTFITLAMSSIESYDREAGGFVVGRWAYRTWRGRRRRVHLLESAIPLLTSDRKPSSMGPANEAAYDRAVRFIHGMDVGLSVIGGFHSHPKGPATLSAGDLDFVRQHHARVKGRGWRLHSDRWLELVIAISRRKTARRGEPDWYWTERGLDLRARFWLPRGERYDLTMAAHLIDPARITGGRIRRADGVVEHVRLQTSM